MKKTIEIQEDPNGSRGVFEKLNGKNHGLWTIFHKNGQKKLERQMYKGRTHGYERCWNKEGILLKEDNYWRDLRHGASKEWYNSGRIKRESSWEMGYAKGYYREWNEQGEKTIERYYESHTYEDIKNKKNISNAWKLTRKYIGFDPNNHTQTEADSIITEFMRKCICFQEKECIAGEDIFKKSILGDVNIKLSSEEWPECDGVPLSPVVQINMNDLPFRIKEIEDVDFIAVFIHPNDPAKLLDDDRSLIIRSYKSSPIEYLKKPLTFQLKELPKAIQFQVKKDYPNGDFSPGIEEFLEENYGDNNPYQCEDGSKLFGWPFWIQWSDLPMNSVFILQINGYNLWEYGESSTLYIFRNLETKAFHGFIQIA